MEQLGWETHSNGEGLLLMENGQTGKASAVDSKDPKTIRNQLEKDPKAYQKQTQNNTKTTRKGPTV